jgi:GDP-fucose transporter C1
MPACQFAQTIIAVILLQIGSNIWPRRLHLDSLTVKETMHLAPLVIVGLVGLIFNTFCLRDVDTTFFQVSYDFQYLWVTF